MGRWCPRVLLSSLLSGFGLDLPPWCFLGGFWQSGPRCSLTLTDIQAFVWEDKRGKYWGSESLLPELVQVLARQG